MDDTTQTIAYQLTITVDGDSHGCVVNRLGVAVGRKQNGISHTG